MVEPVVDQAPDLEDRGRQGQGHREPGQRRGAADREDRGDDGREAEQRDDRPAPVGRPRAPAAAGSRGSARRAGTPTAACAAWPATGRPATGGPAGPPRSSSWPHCRARVGDNAGMPSALLLPVLTCAAVLLVSGVAKLRAPRHASTPPSPRSGSHGASTPRSCAGSCRGSRSRSAPGCCSPPGPALVVVAVLTLLLFVAYLVLVVRAVRRPEPVDCGCFGALGDSEVTTVTVWRNAAARAVGCAGRGRRRCAGSGADRRSLDDAGAWPGSPPPRSTAAVAVLVTYRAPAAGLRRRPARGPGHRRDRRLRARRHPRAAVLTEDGRARAARRTRARGRPTSSSSSRPGADPAAGSAPRVAELGERARPGPWSGGRGGQPDVRREPAAVPARATPGSTPTASPARPSARAPRPPCCSAPTGWSRRSGARRGGRPRRSSPRSRPAARGARGGRRWRARADESAEVSDAR